MRREDCDMSERATGHFIRQHRQGTQSAAAKVLGISVPYFCDMEHGNRFVPWNRMAAMATYLNCPIETLIELRIVDELRATIPDYTVTVRVTPVPGGIQGE
jgi:transcriptional regulator with XRE-family HTH domain